MVTREARMIFQSCFQWDEIIGSFSSVISSEDFRRWYERMKAENAITAAKRTIAKRGPPYVVQSITLTTIG